MNMKSRTLSLELDFSNPAEKAKHGKLVALEAVQQSKIGRKRKVDNALNLKRRNIFGTKINCETASLVDSMLELQKMTTRREWNAIKSFMSDR